MHFLRYKGLTTIYNLFLHYSLALITLSIVNSQS